jgi:hypothetical protein
MCFVSFVKVKFYVSLLCFRVCPTMTANARWLDEGGLIVAPSHYQYKSSIAI